MTELQGQLSDSEWTNNLNDFMGALSEFLIAAASANNFGSICAQIAMALANSVPVRTNVEDFASANDKAKNE